MAGAVRAIGPVPGLIVLLILLTLSGSPPAIAVEFLPPTGPALELEVRKGRIVRLDRPAATVFVADPTIADIQVKSPSLVYVIGAAVGETTLYAVDERERVIASVDIRVTHNVGALEAVVRQRYPDLPVKFLSVGNAIVIDGTVSTPAIAEDIQRMAAPFLPEKGELVNRLTIREPVQVNLRVRVAEMSRSARKQLGFNWDVVADTGSFAFGFATANPFAANALPDVLFGNAAKTGATGLDANGVIDALAEEGLVSILAEPNLTALTGETASFLAGGEFPILVPQGDFRVTIEFKPFGVSVSFTPTILSAERINMRVRPEVSELTQDGAVQLPFGDQVLQVPALRVRRAETTVELGSGQSFAIAGLLQNNTIHSVHELPFLGDIPVLGQLFRSDDFQRDESELVIIVTPYIVRPTPGNVLATPADGFESPNDIERIASGGVHRGGVPAGEPSIVLPDGSRVVGEIGFMLE